MSTQVIGNARFRKSAGDDSRGGDFVYRMDFSRLIQKGVEIASVTASAPSGLGIANEDVSILDFDYQGVTIPAGRSVEFDLYGGTAGSTYEITILVTLPGGSQIEGKAEVVVE